MPAVLIMGPAFFDLAFCKACKDTRPLIARVYDLRQMGIAHFDQWGVSPSSNRGKESAVQAQVADLLV